LSIHASQVDVSTWDSKTHGFVGMRNLYWVSEKNDFTLFYLTRKQESKLLLCSYNPNSEVGRRSRSVEIPGREENSNCKRKFYNKNPTIVPACYVADILDTKSRFVKFPNCGVLTILPQNATFLVLNRVVSLPKPSNGGFSSNRR
jgi:hypothetical protein